MRVYIVTVNSATNEGDESNAYLFTDYDKAYTAYKEFIANEMEPGNSWVGEIQWDEEGEPIDIERYHYSYDDNNSNESDVYWRIDDLSEPVCFVSIELVGHDIELPKCKLNTQDLWQLCNEKNWFTNIHKDRLEEIVLNAVIDAIEKPDVLEKLVDHLLAIQEKISEKSTRLSSLTKDKKEAETALANIMKAVEMGVVNNTTQRRMSELEIQLKNIDEQILIEKAKTTKLLSADAIRQYYKQAIRLEPKLLTNYLIKGMILYDDRVKITLNSPQLGNPENTQDFPLTKTKSHQIQYYNSKVHAVLKI